MIPLLQYKSTLELYTRLSAEEFARYFFDDLKPELEEAYMLKRWRHDKEYQYSGTFFRFIWNGFNRFNGIWGGKLRISKENGLVTIHNLIDFREVFIFCCLFSIIPILDMWNQTSYRIILAALIWAVYFGNYFVTLFRINAFLKRKIMQTFIDNDRVYRKKLL